MTPARLRLGVFATWLLACVILLWIMRDAVATMTMLDADDYLRLQQVRDWLGGQSFFDVTQYRIDPPHGVPMHWSRLVDLPLGAMILLLRPLLGSAGAETVTIAVVPLLTLGGTMAAIALIATRLADRRAALIAVMLAATSPLLLFHVMPTRIDHHGWQTMLGLFTVAACLDRKAVRGGLLAGTCAALWLTISLEALPMVVAIGVLLALQFVIFGDRHDSARRFHGFAVALALAGLALFAGFHGRAAWFEIHCDATGPAWFGPLLVTPALAALFVPAATRRGPLVRIVALTIAGAAGAALLAFTAPACLGGPFAALDPVVRALWYDNVTEGLPIWDQRIDHAITLAGFPLIGIAGCLLGRRTARTAGIARNWVTMLLILITAFAVSLMVQRAGGFAHGCALPGAGLLLARMLDRIGRMQRPVARILASTAAIVALSPVGALAAGNLAMATRPTQPDDAKALSAVLCDAPCAPFAALAAMKPALILAGIDSTPSLLVNSPHRFVGSGHHRAQQAIRRVIDAFTRPPEVAHRIMAEHHIDYVLIEPGGNESRIYSRLAPDGLMARLGRGEAPAWLAPVPLPHSPLKMWRRIG